MMTRRKRFWILISASVAIVTMVLLATGLSGLEFHPARSLPLVKSPEDAWIPELGATPGGRILELLFAVLYFLAVLLMPIAIIYFLLSPEARRRVLRSLGLLLWILAIYFVMRARANLLQQLEMLQEGTALPEDLLLPTIEFAANPPQWIVVAMTIGLALLIAGGLVGAIWYIWRRTHRPGSPLEELAQEAEGALEKLQAGADLKDTVMRCYFEMGRTLREQRGLEREEAMTPREFERYLAGAGLPEEHIRQLTRLFEAVRYGDRVPGRREERQAVDCLTAIVRVARSLP